MGSVICASKTQQVPDDAAEKGLRHLVDRTRLRLLAQKNYCVRPPASPPHPQVSSVIEAAIATAATPDRVGAAFGWLTGNAYTKGNACFGSRRSCRTPRSCAVADDRVLPRDRVAADDIADGSWTAWTAWTPIIADGVPMSGPLDPRWRYLVGGVDRRRPQMREAPRRRSRRPGRYAAPPSASRLEIDAMTGHPRPSTLSGRRPTTGTPRQTAVDNWVVRRHHAHCCCDHRRPADPPDQIVAPILAGICSP